MTELQREQIPKIVDKWLRQALDDAESQRATQWPPLSAGRIEEKLMDLDTFKMMASDDLTECRYKGVGKAVDLFLEEEGYELDKDKDPETYGMLCRAMLKCCHRL